MVYFALHKPTGVITTRADERGRRTVYDLLPADLPWLSPVGRLDLDSSGLLLLTNDTQLADAVTSSESVAKVYEVTFDAPLTAADQAQFTAGMTLADGTALLAVGVEMLAADGTRALLTLREGKNRQIRRMAKDRGLEVVRLHRLALGPLQLGDLPAGELRPLTPAEIGALQQLRAARRR
jgi:23S rRNA pseudouridine2605 synthase